jgi:hypothetical protein
MSPKPLKIGVILLLGTALVAVPAMLNTTAMTLELAKAQAQAGGNAGGNGGGNAGGNGGGNAGGNGNGNGEGGGSANNAGGNDKADKSAELAGFGETAAERRSLNAAHASLTGMDNASPNSVPGQIGSYRDAVQEGDFEAAAAALAEASNRDLTAASIESVNGLLGLDLDPSVEQDLADRANELRDENGP